MSAPAGASSADASSGSKRSLPDATNADERRVQSRRFAAGSSSAAAASSSSGDGAASVESDQPPPATRLYRHALESIFAFLNQRELAAALQVSRGWLAAVESMGSLQLTVATPPAPNAICVVAESVMGRHVSQLGLINQRVPLTANSLFILARHMEHLRKLFAGLRLAPTQGRLAFPPALQELDLRIDDAPSATDVNAALLAIGGLPLLESFTIALPTIDSQLSFAPLASTPLLRDLRIVQQFVGPNLNRDLTNTQVAQLRALPLLRRLDVQPMSTSMLRRLLATPHDLQWQSISPPSPLDVEVAALLPQLPSLTQINARCAVSNFDWLQQLPNLKHVDMQIYRFGEEVVESLMAALQHCRKIEYLSLQCVDLLTAHLTDLLPQLPRLRNLELVQTAIESLSFLAQAPLTQQLRSLELCMCTELPAAELRHVTHCEGSSHFKFAVRSLHRWTAIRCGR